MPSSLLRVIFDHRHKCRVLHRHRAASSYRASVDETLAEVVELELLLLQPEVRNDARRLLSFLHPDFFEYGASGRVWQRHAVAEATSETHEAIEATRVGARRVGQDAVLVTYRSEASGRRALRSSTWVREDGRWLLLFHQGTLTDET